MAERSAAGEILTELILEVFRLNGELLDAGNRLTKPFGLTSARWQVMGAIELAGTPLTVAQIARRMGLSRQGVQRIVNDLSRLNMVKRAANMDHKRAPLISISPKGKKTMEKVNAAQVLWVNELSQGMSERGMRQAHRLLQDLRDRSEAQT